MAKKGFAEYIKDGDDAMQKRDIDLAIASYSRAITLAAGVAKDEEVEARLKRAGAYCVREMYSEAIVDCSDVLADNQDYAKAMTVRAFAYYRSGRRNDAKLACTTILSLPHPKPVDPDFRPFAYELQMSLLSEDGKFDEVIKTYEKAKAESISSFLIMQKSVEAFIALGRI
jgi:tetratricopeptide (TPR) repeat protein